MRVNNAFYETHGDAWWRDDAGFEYTSLRYAMNPVRFAWFSTQLARDGVATGRVLDVGCGGGYLAEAFASAGYEVAAIDPAASSIAAARDHACQAGLDIDYRVGCGECLPFADGSFDVVACCDVLEHVNEPDRVIEEVARALRPGGHLLYDTVNRTRKSRFVLIKLWQDWGLGGSGEKNLHVWDKFIRPDELGAMLTAHGLEPHAQRGIASARNPVAMAWSFLAIRRGRVCGPAVGPALGLRESDDVSISYMGVAVKGGGAG